MRLTNDVGIEGRSEDGRTLFLWFTADSTFGVLVSSVLIYQRVSVSLHTADDSAFPLSPNFRSFE